MVNEYDHVSIDVIEEDSYATLTLERPRKLNALSRELLDDLLSGLRELNGMEAVKGVLIQGSGRVFCGGVDLNELREITPDEGQALGRILKEIFLLIRSSQTIFVASIHEGCYGAAFELVLACDGVVAVEGTGLGLPEIKLGVPSMIDAALLQDVVGLMRAREILLTGETYPAETLQEWGMINRVVPAGDLDEVSISFLSKMIQNPSHILGMQKELIRTWMNVPLEEGIKHSIDVFSLSVMDNQHLKEEASRILDQ